MRQSLAFVLCLFSAVFSLHAQADITFNRDVPVDVQNQIRGDLTFVLGMQGGAGTAYYAKIFASNVVNGQALGQFFAQRIFNIGMSDCGGGPSVAACVQPYFGPNTMWLTKNYVTFNIPQIYRISIIFHEARHTERQYGFWSHAICPTPYKDEQGRDITGIVSGAKMEGKAACDVTPYGSYGLQATLLKNIERSCANCNQKMRMDAKLFGDDTVNRISDVTVRRSMRDDFSR